MVTSRPESPDRTFLRSTAVSANAVSAHSASTWHYLPAKRAGRTFLRGEAVPGIPHKLAQPPSFGNSAQTGQVPAIGPSRARPAITQTPFPLRRRRITFSARTAKCCALHLFLSGAVPSLFPRPRHFAVLAEKVMGRLRRGKGAGPQHFAVLAEKVMGRRPRGKGAGRGTLPSSRKK